MHYNTIVFLQGEDYNQAIEESSPQTESDWYDYLSQWDYGDSADDSAKAPWGGADNTHIIQKNDTVYVLAHNESLGYISLTRVDRDPVFFDRFDIVEAYYLFYCDFHEGQWSEKYERLSRVSRYFKPSPYLNFDRLSANAKELYLRLAEKEKMSLETVVQNNL